MVTNARFLRDSLVSTEKMCLYQAPIRAKLLSSASRLTRNKQFHICLFEWFKREKTDAEILLSQFAHFGFYYV